MRAHRSETRAAHTQCIHTMEVKHACEAYVFDYNERAIAMNDRISAERLWPQHSVERIADPVHSLAIEQEPAPYQTNDSACGFTQQALACNFNVTTANKAPEWENCWRYDEDILPFVTGVT